VISSPHVEWGRLPGVSTLGRQAHGGLIFLHVGQLFLGDPVECERNPNAGASGSHASCLLDVLAQDLAQADMQEVSGRCDCDESQRVLYPPRCHQNFPVDRRGRKALCARNTCTGCTTPPRRRLTLWCRNRASPCRRPVRRRSGVERGVIEHDLNAVAGLCLGHADAILTMASTRHGAN